MRLLTPEVKFCVKMLSISRLAFGVGYLRLKNISARQKCFLPTFPGLDYGFIHAGEGVGNPLAGLRERSAKVL
jgi:hypothetical protein